MPAAVVACAEDVVQGQPGVVERLRQVRDAVDREEQRLEPDEMGREVEQARPLGERLADQPEPELLQVAQAAVDEPRRARGGPDRDVVLFDQGRAHPARRRIEEGAGADDPAADDDHVPGLVRQASRDRGARAASGGRARHAPSGSVIDRLAGRRREIRQSSQPVADDQDEDRERRVVDRRSGPRRAAGRSATAAPEHDGDRGPRRAGPRANRAGDRGASSATVRLRRDADRRDEDLARVRGAASRQRGRSWAGGR